MKDDKLYKDEFIKKLTKNKIEKDHRYNLISYTSKSIMYSSLNMLNVIPNMQTPIQIM